MTKYVCNGTTGAKGDKGEQGVAGTNGIDGKNTLANTVIEPSGVNCSTGGVKVEYGIDSNNNGVLDNSEINSALTKYVCNGLTGAKGETGHSALIRTTSETPGLNCVNGGTKIETGLDINSNGILEDNEVNILQTKFICNILVKNDFLTYSGNSIVSNDTISPLMRFIGNGKEGDFDCATFNGELIGEHFYKNFKVNSNCTLKLGKAQTTIIHVKDTCFISGVIDGHGGLVLPFDEKRDWIGAGGGCTSVGICQSCSFGNYTWTFSPDGLTQLLGYGHSKTINKETGYNMTLNDLRVSSFLGTKINGYSSQKITCGNFSTDYVAQGGSGLIIICQYLIFNGKIILDGSEGKRIVDPGNNVQVIGPGGGGSLIISSDNVIQNNGLISTNKGLTTNGNPGAGDGTTYLIFY